MTNDLKILWSLVVGFMIFGPLSLRAEEQIEGHSLQAELNFMHQRKTDFKRDRVQMSESERLTPEKTRDLDKLLRFRLAEKSAHERARQHYVNARPKVDDMDAVKRESIEDKIQERQEAEQTAREKKFNLLAIRRERAIIQAHLDVDENQEYDLHVPKKEDHAKPRKGKPRK